MSERMPLATEDPNRERTERLRRDFPEAFTEGKIDFEKLRAALGEDVSGERERYGLSWAGKSGAIRNIQTPSVATLVPQRGESVAFDETENLFIEGDNLEVLKLLQKSYYGRVKMIYIDPPYNTGNEFIYPDNFREGIDDYLRYSGQTDEEGVKLATNTETGGRYHSKWLNMMYPRLFLARNLLREDGVIFISIDDHEVHNLLLMMNEIFGEENFVASVLWQKRYSPSNDTVDFSASHDFILVYAKTRNYAENGKIEAILSKLERTAEQNKVYKNPDNDERGLWRPDNYTCNKSASERPNLYYPVVQPNTGEEIWPNKSAVWRYSRDKHAQYEKENRIWWGKNGTNRVPSYKRFLSDVGGVIANTWWTWEEAGHNDESKKEIRKLLPDVERAFDTPKPTRLIRRMLQLSTKRERERERERETEPDIILDFFAGSATTAHAVMEMNREDGGDRRFIMVQLPEKTDNPDYPTIADIGRERVRRVITNLNSQDEGRLPDEGAPEQDRGFRAFRLTSSNFAIWDGEAARDAEGEVLDQQVLEFADNVNPDRSPEDILYEILLKSGLPLTAKVEEVPVAGKSIYSVAGGLLVVCLAAQIDEDLVRGVMALEPRPERFVCLDAAFGDNDALKTNTKLQARDSGVGFRTV